MRMNRGQARQLFVAKAILLMAEGKTRAEAEAQAHAEVQHYRDLRHRSAGPAEFRVLLTADARDVVEASHKASLPEPRRCYYIGSDSWVDGRGYQVGIVTEFQADYALTDWFWNCDYATACQLAQERNDRMGINRVEALKIVDSSILHSFRPMFGGARHAVAV